jgi:predicted porin
MKKTLIAAAVAAAVAAPAANAGVVIYGQLHVSVDYYDYTETAFGVVVDEFTAWEVNSNTSRIGFKGSEDLGNGLKAIWKLENSVRITDTGSTFGSHDGARGHWGSARNAYVGLAGDWGTVLVGRHDTPYKMAFYSTGIDMLGDSVIDVNRLYGITEVRADNAIAYVSPNMNGLTIAAAIVPGEGYTNTVTGETFDGMADNYSISAMYSNNGLKLAVGYEVLDQGISGTAGDIVCATATLATDCTNLMVGAGYSMNAFDVSGVYIQQDYGIFENDIWALSAAYSFGNNKVIATYGQSDVSAFGIDVEELDSYGVAFQHMLSKRTSAYAAYANRSLDEFGGILTAEDDVLSLGMIHKF